MAKPAKRNPPRNARSPTTSRRSERLASNTPVTPQRHRDQRLRRNKHPKPQQLGNVEEEAPEEVSSDDAQIPELVSKTTSSGSNAPKSRAVSKLGAIVDALRSNREMMLQDLSDLDNDASRVLKILATRDIREFGNRMANLRDPKNPMSKRLETCMSSFQNYAEAFIATDLSLEYVRPGLVLTALFGDFKDLETAKWRPDDVLFKANAALMSIYLVRLEQDSHKTRDTLEYLDQHFHELFFNNVDQEASKPGDSALVEAAFYAALAIRTQLAVVLSHGDDFDKDTLKELFLFEGSEQTADSPPHMKGWGVYAFEDTDDIYLAEPFKGLAYRKFEELWNASSRNMTSLHKWEDFHSAMALWASLRSSELDSKIRALGGAGEIQLALEEKVRNTNNAAAKSTPRSSSAQDGRRVSGGTNQARALGEMAKLSTGGERIIMPQHIKQTPKSKRSMYDAQPNAEKEIFDDSQENPSPRNDSSVTVVEPEGRNTPQRSSLDHAVTQDQGFRDLPATSSKQPPAGGGRDVPAQQVGGARSNARAGQKRRREQQEREEEQVEEEQGEEGEGGNNETSRFKKPRQTEQQTSPQRRPRAQEQDNDYVPENGDVDDDDDRDAQEEEESGEKPQPESQIPHNFVPPKSAPIETMKVKRQLAKEPKKSREAWSQGETDALLYYMEKYKNSWQKIKDMDEAGPNMLSKRENGVGLKDRARNLKIIYLRCGTRLPDCLEAVPLKKEDIKRLAGLGIDAR